MCPELWCTELWCIAKLWCTSLMLIPQSQWSRGRGSRVDIVIAIAGVKGAVTTPVGEGTWAFCSFVPGADE